MTVFPMMDRTSGEVILIYRNKRKGEKTGWLDAEVYKFHLDTNIATHYGAFDLNEEYLAMLEVPTSEHEITLAMSAVAFYERHLKSLPGGSEDVQYGESRTFAEYLAARRKFPLDKTPSEG